MLKIVLQLATINYLFTTKFYLMSNIYSIHVPKCRLHEKYICDTLLYRQLKEVSFKPSEFISKSHFFRNEVSVSRSECCNVNQIIQGKLRTSA